MSSARGGTEQYLPPQTAAHPSRMSKRNEKNVSPSWCTGVPRPSPSIAFQRNRWSRRPRFLSCHRLRDSSSAARGGCCQSPAVAADWSHPSRPHRRPPAKTLARRRRSGLHALSAMRRGGHFRRRAAVAPPAGRRHSRVHVRGGRSVGSFFCGRRRCRRCRRRCRPRGRLLAQVRRPCRLAVAEDARARPLVCQFRQVNAPAAGEVALPRARARHGRRRPLEGGWGGGRARHTGGNASCGGDGGRRSGGGRWGDATTGGSIVAGDRGSSSDGGPRRQTFAARRAGSPPGGRARMRR